PQDPLPIILDDNSSQFSSHATGLLLRLRCGPSCRWIIAYLITLLRVLLPIVPFISGIRVFCGIGRRKVVGTGFAALLGPYTSRVFAALPALLFRCLRV